MIILQIYLTANEGGFFFVFFWTFCKLIRKEVQFALSSRPETNSYTNDRTCIVWFLTNTKSCITESVMVSEAFNSSTTLTVEIIFLGHYSYDVKNILY